MVTEIERPERIHEFIMMTVSDGDVISEWRKVVASKLLWCLTTKYYSLSRNWKLSQSHHKLKLLTLESMHLFIYFIYSFFFRENSFIHSTENEILSCTILCSSVNRSWHFYLVRNNWGTCWTLEIGLMRILKGCVIINQSFSQDTLNTNVTNVDQPFCLEWTKNILCVP